GSLRLFLSPTNCGDHRVVPSEERRATRDVAAIVLDELLASEPQVDFVKIDVQGAEVAVLRGLTRTLNRNPALRILCELCPWLLRLAGARAEEFFAPLRQARLSPHRLGRLGTVEAIDETRAWKAAETAGYINLYFRRV